MPWVANATPEVDASSQWRTIVAVCVVLGVVSMVIAGMRVYIRAKARGMGADDAMATLSLVFAILYSIICIIRKSHLEPPIIMRRRWLTVHRKNRNKIRPGSPDQETPGRKSHTLHANKLRRQTDIPGRHQFLQDRLADQLPAALRPHKRAACISADCPGCHRTHLPLAPGLRARPHLRLQSGMILRFPFVIRVLQRKLTASHARLRNRGTPICPGSASTPARPSPATRS